MMPTICCVGKSAVVADSLDGSVVAQEQAYKNLRDEQKKLCVKPEGELRFTQQKVLGLVYIFAYQTQRGNTATPTS
jgi:hypothetical protein